MVVVKLKFVLGDTPYGNLQLEDGIAKDGLTDAYDRIPMVNHYGKYFFYYFENHFRVYVQSKLQRKKV